MHSAWFESGDPAGGWHARLEGLSATHVATRVDEVEVVLALADRAAREGRWAAVAVAYEAAAAFEPALVERGVPTRQAGPPQGVPLVWVGIYERGRSARSGRADRPDPPDRSDRPTLEPTVGVEEFTARVRAVQEHIREGNTYQVNLTFAMRAGGVPALDDWYAELRDAQRARYCARLDVGRHVIFSLSPELFFERRGDLVVTRPMKGTARRGRWLQEDDACARALVASDKERAENVMVVDLLRNDISRVARVGTVRVPELFHLERYPTLWQMTSTVEAHIVPATTLRDLFRALFPSGSVTGAPKIRTMQIIAALEHQPRGLYTGAIGFVRPGGDCTFAVAIRTIVIDRETGVATLGVGAGITADSVPHLEYQECLLKAAFANSSASSSSPLPLPPSQFSLLETIRLEDGRIDRLDRHLARMADSATYFDYAWDGPQVRRALETARAQHASGGWRLRLVVDPHGVPTVTCTALEAADPRRWRVALAESPIDDRSPFLFNKTTNRALYEAARAARPDVDEVVLWNQRGEVTESTMANVVAELDGVRVTPPVASGLLAGAYRAELLEAGAVREGVITKDDLGRASRLWLINSLRGWIPAELVA